MLCVIACCVGSTAAREEIHANRLVSPKLPLAHPACALHTAYIVMKEHRDERSTVWPTASFKDLLGSVDMFPPRVELMTMLTPQPHSMMQLLQGQWPFATASFRGISQAGECCKAKSDVEGNRSPTVQGPSESHRPDERSQFIMKGLDWPQDSHSPGMSLCHCCVCVSAWRLACFGM